MIDAKQQRLGVVYATAAYLWWGFIPLYFKVVAHVGPVEVLAHRVVWSCLFVGMILVARGRGRELVATLADRRTCGTLAVTAILIAVNWLVYIWAVVNERVLEASLGYYINPLVNVAMGAIFLRERLTRRQVLAVALAAVGVVWLTVAYGRPPWVSLVVAGTFATYGLLRKTARPGGTLGLGAETLLLTPLAVAFMLWRARDGQLVFGHLDRGTDLWLLAAGPITALPLIWFAEGARRLRYATLGFLQYLAPTLQFTLAVALFGEAFTRDHAVTFGCIWLALVLYTLDLVRGWRRR